MLVPSELVKGPARIVLTGPGGGTFDLDGPGSERTVTLVADVVDYCRTELTGYKVPRHVYFRAELPKTNVGKILRRELRDELRKRIADGG